MARDEKRSGFHIDMRFKIGFSALVPPSVHQRAQLLQNWQVMKAAACQPALALICRLWAVAHAAMRVLHNLACI